MSAIVRILPRGYSIRDAQGRRRLPRASDVLGHFYRTTNFLADRRLALRGLFEAFHAATFVALVVFVVRFLNLQTALFYAAAVVALETVLNTIWYHRNCSHRAFRFRSRLWPRLFL